MNIFYRGQTAATSSINSCRQ